MLLKSLTKTFKSGGIGGGIGFRESLAAFLLQEGGAREKLTKDKGKFVGAWRLISSEGGKTKAALYFIEA